MGAESSKPNPRNDNSDFYRMHRPQPAPHEVEITTDYHNYKSHRTTPNTMNSTRVAVSTPSAGHGAFTNEVTRPTYQTVNSTTSGAPKLPVIPASTEVSTNPFHPITPAQTGVSRNPVSTGVSRNNTGTPTTVTPRSGEVQRVPTTSVYPVSTGVSRATTASSSGLLKQVTAVSTTGNVAKTNSSANFPPGSEISKPLTATPSISGDSRRLPAIHNIDANTMKANITYPDIRGGLEYSSRTSGTDRPSSSTPSAKEVKTTLQLYPDLPEAKYADHGFFTRCQLESEDRESIRRVLDWNHGVAPTPSEGVNCESDRQTSSHHVINSSRGTVKSQSSSERIEPSCPEYSLWDPLGASREFEVRPGAFVDVLRTRAKDENSNSAKNQDFPCQVGLPDIRLPGRQRDSSPVGSESSYASHQSSVGGNRGRPNKKRSKSRKPKTKVDSNGDDPPQYGDVVAQINAESKAETQKFSPRKNTPQRQYKASDRKNSQHYGRPNPINDRFRPKNVDELNDLIKKEFGSVEHTHNLCFVLEREKLFSGRNRLYVGNLPFDVNREDVNELMSPYGEIVVEHHNAEKKYGFVTLKHRDQAENAQRNLDGYVFKGRSLRVRLANRNICFKVLNLDVWVTNELLKKAFSTFGEVERAEIVVKDGKPTGEAFLEFSDKRAGKVALEACVENCFLLTSSLRPVILQEIDPDHCSRGYSERQINRNNKEYKRLREVGPRFVPEGSKENNCANLWKSFYERRQREEEALAKRMQQEEKLLEDQITSIMSS